VESGLVIAGSPDTVIEGIRRQIDALECTHLMCDFWRPSGMDTRERSMRLFAAEVMPAFRATSSNASGTSSVVAIARSRSAFTTSDRMS
jgi:hypothetical protein